jgi:hypothetical protein
MVSIVCQIIFFLESRWKNGTQDQLLANFKREKMNADQLGSAK